MLKVVDTGKQTTYFLHAEHGWQLSAPWTWRQPKTVVNLTITDIPVEVSDAGQVRLAGSPSQFTFHEKMAEICTYLLICYCLRGLAIMPGQTSDPAYITFLCLFCEAEQLHVFDKLLSDCTAHELPL